MSWHYLQGNKADYGPQKIVCVDTETTRTSIDGRAGTYLEELRLGVASCTSLSRGVRRSRSLFAFDSSRQFWAWVATKLEPRKVVWLFAHNLGFDTRTLDFWSELDRGTFVRQVKRRRSAATKTGERRSEYRQGMLVTADPPTVIECWHANGGMLRMVDTINYWQRPLAAVGKWVGLDKLPMPDPWESDETWLEYCRRDVEILETATVRYINWCRERNCGMFAVTLPSQAMHAYRHSEACTKVCIHDEEEVKKLEGEAHLGGEIYVGFIGRVGHEQNTVQLDWTEERRDVVAAKSGPVHQLDSNSLFPSNMANHLMPVRLLHWRTSGNGSRALVSEMGADCIAECLIRSDDHAVYSRRRGRSGRFLGTFVAVLCGPELASAIQAGVVVAVRRYARYSLADLFSGWVQRWWQMRWMAKLAGYDFESDMCKQIMVSLYGKWAQRNHVWTDVPERCPPQRWGHWFEVDGRTGKVTNWRSIAGLSQRQELAGYHANSFPAISAFVCAYAREHMRELRAIAGERQVYYQGIDSLYVTDIGHERLTAAGKIDPAALGKLRHEDCCDSADFLGWGLYRMGGRWCRTSIARGAIECQPGEFDQQNFERLETALMRSPESGVIVTDQRRTIGAANPVGIVAADGWVSPQPARWGDSPAETSDPEKMYDSDVGNQLNYSIALA